LSNSDLTSILFILLLLVGFAQLFGYICARLRQPKVVGEIFAGVFLGPALIGRLPFAAGLAEATQHEPGILNFCLLAWSTAVDGFFRRGNTPAIHP
jgi:Kef-type K+ transport system membrane component KefB